MPRLVRRKPLLDRVKDYLNPGDFLLWLSEEIETRDWDPKSFGTPLALVLHFVLLIARANSGGGSSKGGDDVFGDGGYDSGWLSYIANFLVYLLTFTSVANAIYTFSRKRHYRLFETAIETPQSTPSARRVRVDSSPVASSPLRFLTSILGDTSVESRIHPDPTRDVWELAVWDPIPICERLFCFFNPGHVLVYWHFLPTLSSDPRPSMTVFTTLLLQLLMSTQLYAYQSYSSQRAKDTAILHKEVASEYDIKFVHPHLNPLMRDVGTQFSADGEEDEQVDTYTPTVIINRGFHTRPNPNYVKHVDPDNIIGVPSRGVSPAPTMSSYTPSAYKANASREPTPFTGVTPRTFIKQPQFRKSTAVATSTGTSTGGDGGSLGVFSHASSPLKKATSLYDMNGAATPRNSLGMASRETQEHRDRSQSPAKQRQSELPPSLFSRNTGNRFGDIEDSRRGSSPGIFGPRTGFDGRQSRGPSRF